MKTIKLIGMCILAAVLGMSVQSCSKDDYQSRIKPRKKLKAKRL